MEIFWRLFLAHLLADFTLQTDWVNRMKRQGVFGMTVHVLTHLAVSSFLIWNYLGKIWFTVLGIPLRGWFMLILLSAVHFTIDEIRVYSVKTLKFPDNTWNFLADQFAHFYCIFLFSPFISFKNPAFIQEKWVVLTTLFVLVSHVTTITIYFLEKDLRKTQFPSFDQKYFMIGERIIIWAFFFVAGYWWIPFVLLWIGQLIYVGRKRIIDVSGLNLGAAVFSSVFFGLVSRYVYYGRF